MKSITTLTISLLLFTLCSCSSHKVVFNDSVKNDMINNGLKLSQIQYYLNTQIKLMSEENRKQNDIQGGKITTKSLKVRSLIVFQEDTEGVFAREDKETGAIYVKFEEGGDEKEIKFGLHTNSKLSEYRLLIENTRGAIKYDGAEYKVYFNDENPSLLISKSEYMKVTKKVRYAKGVKLQK